MLLDSEIRARTAQQLGYEVHESYRTSRSRSGLSASMALIADGGRKLEDINGGRLNRWESLGYSA